MTLGLDDLCVRFIINLPRADLSTVARICFQVEEAQWFYEDFIRPLDPSLPSMSLRDFCHRIFKHCPLLAPFADHHMKAFEEFMEYKQRIPVRGAILLNEAMDSAVLVKGWKSGAGWSFPRGKINMDEDDLDCAIREVDEEIGFDLRQAGLVPRPKDVKYIDVTLKDQQIRLYVFRNVPMDTVFQPKTRKEISKIAWYKLSDLPGTRKKGVIADANAAPVSAPVTTSNNKFYMVAPFLGHLKKWIAQQKRRDAARNAHASYDGSSSYVAAQATLEEPLTEEETGTQTDAGHDEPAPAPSREVMEGADEELRRMLQLQPPTQGLQLGAAEHESAQKDSGSALLALLRGGTSTKHPEQDTAQQPAQQSGSRFVYQHSVPLGHPQIPHTPVEHVLPNALQPHTPHHHHPSQILPPNNFQPPPNFPLVQHANQGQFVQQQQFPHHQNQPPNHQFHPGRTAQMPLVPAANYYSNAPAHAQPFHQQQQYMDQPRTNPMGPRPQPQKAPEILHPQPLPPQAQSILTRSMIPTPQLPESNGRPMGGVGGHGPVPQGQMAMRENHMPNGSQGSGHQQQGQLHQQIPPQLNSHAMSLLSAFKAGPTTRAEPQPSAEPPNQVAHTPLAPQGQYQEAQGFAPRTAPSAGQHGQQPLPPSVSTLMNILQQPHGAGSPGSASGSRPSHQRQQSDAQRSALLNMFKKQTPVSPSSGSDATVKPTKPTQERLAEDSMSNRPVGQVQHPRVRATVASPRANVGHITAHTEQNLPFRPVQILSRAKQAENISSAQSHGANNPAQLPASSLHDGVRQDVPPAVGSANPPSIIAQVANAYNAAAKGRDAVPHTQASNAPYKQLQPAARSPADILQGRPHDGNPDQAKKLLSLFGQPQSPEAETTLEGKGKMRDTNVPAQARSRVASASHTLGGADAAQGASTSRRGSGLPPISPSDTAFLLNFLNKQTV